MARSIIAAALAAALLLALPVAPQPAYADKVTVINYYGAPPFVIGGYSYIPLRDVTDFLGAALLWDSIKNRATITYNGRDVGLVIGSPVAYLVGRTATLPVAPVLIGGRVYVPSVVLVKHLDIPVVYEPSVRVLKILKGPKAWGTLKVGAPPKGIHVAAGLKVPPGHRVSKVKVKAKKAAAPTKGKQKKHGAGKGQGKAKGKN